MTQLLVLIRSLPKVLQDLINEYNVEHRPKMKNVLKEASLIEEKDSQKKLILLNHHLIKLRKMK